VEPTAEEADFRNLTESQRIARERPNGMFQKARRPRLSDPTQGHVPDETSSLGSKPQSLERPIQVPSNPAQRLLPSRHPHPQDAGAPEARKGPHPLQDDFQGGVMPRDLLQGLPDLQGPFLGDLPQEPQGQVQILGPNPPDGGAGTQRILNRNQPSLNLGPQLDGNEETKHASTLERPEPGPGISFKFGPPQRIPVGIFELAGYFFLRGFSSAGTGEETA